MSNRKAHNEFDIIKTGDGSPTLSLAQGEKMHSMDGALSESLYIYGSALEQNLDLPCPKVLSLGLGLGYNELLTLAYLLKSGISNFYIASFEKQTFLTEYFLNWLHNEDTPLNPCYRYIAGELENMFELVQGSLHEFALESEHRHQIDFFGELTAENVTGRVYHTIYYDAFSSNTDGDLWGASYLENFIINYCDPVRCNFATYAATGNLTRALKAQGFRVTKPAGYGNKRESTYATRLAL